MQKQAAFRLGAGLTCLIAAATAAATPPAGPASAPQSPEVMLYVTVPVGGGSRGMKLPSFSLRVGQARLGGNSGNPSAGDPMQHRELFRLEVFGRQRPAASPDVRLELGGRVAYDFKRGVFGLRTDGWKRPSVIPAEKPSAAPVMSARHERITRLPPGLHSAVQGNRALEADLP